MEVTPSFFVWRLMILDLTIYKDQLVNKYLEDGARALQPIIDEIISKFITREMTGFKFLGKNDIKYR